MEWITGNKIRNFRKSLNIIAENCEDSQCVFLDGNNDLMFDYAIDKESAKEIEQQTRNERLIMESVKEMEKIEQDFRRHRKFTKRKNTGTAHRKHKGGNQYQNDDDGDECDGEHEDDDEDSENGEYINNSASEEEDESNLSATSSTSTCNGSSTEKDSESLNTSSTASLLMQTPHARIPLIGISTVEDLSDETTDCSISKSKEVEAKTRKKTTNRKKPDHSNGAGEPLGVSRASRAPSRIPRSCNRYTSKPRCLQIPGLSEISDRPPESPEPHAPVRRVRINEEPSCRDYYPSSETFDGVRANNPADSSMSIIDLKPILKNGRNRSKCILNMDR